jgi:hypothetical protein
MITILKLPRDRAFNDPDEQLREWAQEQLKNLTHNQNREDTL